MLIKAYTKKNVLKNAIIFVIAVTFITVFVNVISNSTANSDNISETIDAESVKLPILMYHSIYGNRNINNKFIVSVNLFESDMRYIKNKGFNSIFVQDLIDFVYNDKPLPNNPIMITFDDGYYNNYLYVLPIIKKYNIKIIFSPIGKEIERYSEIHDEHISYAYVNWSQINEMVNSGLVEIQNHTYDMHSAKPPRIGCKKKNGESESAYRDNLKKDIQKLQDLLSQNVGISPTAFVYPYGAYSKSTLDILKEIGFKCTFICEGKCNTITKDPDSLYNLCRFIRPASIPTQKFFDKILT